AYRKCAAMSRIIECVSETTLEKMDANFLEFDKHCAEAAMSLWPEAIAEPGLPLEHAVDLGHLVVNAQARYGADRIEVVQKLLPDFEKAFPKSSAPFVLAGNVCTQYAWDARGGGWANTVTPEGWKLFHERLEMASVFLEKGYQLDPADPAAATAMLHVELGQGRGKDVMEKWFQRA